MQATPEATSSALAEQHARVVHELRERVKELNCLYGIARLSQGGDLPMETLIREVAALVCQSWQYPEIACARIQIGGLVCRTPNYRACASRQTSAIFIQEERIGEIEVGYLEPRPEGHEGPFLLEERHLINAVADKLGRLVQTNRSEAQMRILSRELIKAQETERLRIATELHDHLAQDLAAIKLELGGIEGLSKEANPALAESLGKLADQLSKTITGIRDLAYDLLPPGLEDLGLVTTLSRYCSDFAKRSGLAVDYFADGMDGVRLDFESQINLYRLVQEALTNVRKHAQASRITVRLICSHPCVILRIEDDGCGVDIDRRMDEFYKAKRMGIWGMRERARLLGGRITLKSKPGKGMRIHIEIPIRGVHGA